MARGGRKRTITEKPTTCKNSRCKRTKFTPDANGLYSGTCDNCADHNIHRNQEITLLAFTHYSNGHPPFCICCGITHMEFLCLDNIFGDGIKKRGGSSSEAHYAHKIFLKTGEWPPVFRTMCTNCNGSLSKKGYCPHNQGFKEAEDKDWNLVENVERQYQKFFGKVEVLNEDNHIHHRTDSFIGNGSFGVDGRGVDQARSSMLPVRGFSSSESEGDQAHE